MPRVHTNNTISGEIILFPHKVPRVHAARNIGTEVYHEILVESKHSDPDNVMNVGKSEL